ncbi:MAG TPA: hypothetical protein VGB36_04175 [Gammaproteobacteria bacterium]
MDTPKIKRRGFVKVCASAVASVSASPSLLANENGTVHHYNRAQLVEANGDPFYAASMSVGETYVFNYPYVTTPSFIINLGKPALDNGPLKTEAGLEYHWQGGVGPGRSIVSFCAICAHKMTHPAKNVSFINYRHETVSFKDGKENTVERSQVIYCCSERSVYDPANGATVLGGPAPQPLAAIHLDYDERDGTLYASGTYGGEMYRKFFDKFAFRLALEHQTSDIQARVTGTTRVMTIEEYSRTQMLC